MGEVLRVGRGMPGRSFDMATEVTPEQVAASLARLETELRHLSLAIDRFTGHLDRMDARVSITEKLAEKAGAVWWSMTKALGILVGGVGGAVWLLEHGSKIAGMIR